MMIHSDWHIHSEASYDASLTLEEIARKTKEFGFCRFGITDHLNFNDPSFIGDLKKSARLVKAFQKEDPRIVLGVELTPIEKGEFDYIAKNGTREGYGSERSMGIELGMTKEELKALGVRYAIGASHWRIDIPERKSGTPKELIKEWHRQQIWLACDERVTILGHPWYNGNGAWYEDFALIPRTMNQELMAALKENKKYAECNSHFFTTSKATEKFRHQYAEFLRELHESGIPITYGSDSHDSYGDAHLLAEKYLLAAGFKDGEIKELDEKIFW